jgi:FMN phosphatase YigB (HAD superfamily)
MKTLFVDFDGTICTDRFWRSLPPDQYEITQQAIFSEDSPLAADWMRGKYTSEEINKRVAVALGTPYEVVWDMYVRDCREMRVNPELLALIDELRLIYHVVLITGNMDSFDRFTIPALELDQHFDVIVNSANEQKLKTDNDGESFLKYLKGEIADAVLIEDSPKTCAVFTALGGTALQVTPITPTLMHLQSLLNS